MSAKLFNRYLDHLKEIVEDFSQDVDTERVNWQHQCFESAIFAYGRLMIPDHSKNVKQFNESDLFSGQCYEVSKRLALSDSSLTYCEGYAAAEGMNSSTPLRHAWLLDKSGHVFDPTWGTIGIWYYGVPFATNWVKQIWTGRAISDSDYDRSIFQANYLERHSILRDGIPQRAIVTF